MPQLFKLEKKTRFGKRLNWSTWHEGRTKKKTDSPTGMETMTSWTLGGHSIHWARRIKWPCSPWVPVAQWIEHPPGIHEVKGLIPVRESDFFFVPRSCLVGQFLMIDANAAITKMNWKNFRLWAGFEHTTSALPAQCSPNWAIKATRGWPCVGLALYVQWT